jgi:ABC-2 type transport system permease protein
MHHTPPLPSVNHSLVFARLRWKMLRNTCRTVLWTSPVRLVTIILCSVLVWAAVFAISALGFAFVAEKQIPFAGAIIGLVFDLLFLSLAVMLVFSGSIILYSSLFAQAETSFLLSTPARDDQVFAYKFQGAVAFSSWAFLLLGSPILVAHGTAHGVAWYFYVLLPLFFVGFVLLPGSLGALLCLAIVNLAPRARRQVFVFALLLVLGVAGFGIYRLVRTARDAANVEPVQQLIGQLDFARSAFMPTHWISDGLLAAARHEPGAAFYDLALIWSNGLLLYVFTAWVAGRLYRRGFNRLATGGSLRRRYGGGSLDRAVSNLLGFLDPQTRLLIVKDFRTFRREPAQWAQVVIFGGLMLLYFSNTRKFYQQDIGRPYTNGVSLLNLAVTALLMCAYTGRFIYPMLSLEGSKFWLLGLLPLRRERLLWGKFMFSALGTVLTAEVLIVVSDVLLAVPAAAVLLHLVTTAVLALGLSGLSVGLGAWMPNFRESDPSKIAVGFGGTLNLVACLLFLTLLLTVMAAPYHLYSLGHPDDGLLETLQVWWLDVGVALGVLLGVLAVVMPLRVGARTLDTMEF